MLCSAYLRQLAHSIASHSACVLCAHAAVSIIHYYYICSLYIYIYLYLIFVHQPPHDPRTWSCGRQSVAASCVRVGRCSGGRACAKACFDQHIYVHSRIYVNNCFFICYYYYVYVYIKYTEYAAIHHIIIIYM